MSNKEKSGLDSNNFPVSNSYVTCGNKQSYHFEWKIDQFNLMCGSIETIISPLLPHNEDNENQWTIQIERANYTSIYATNNIFFYFQLFNEKDIQEYVDCTLYLKSASNQIYKFLSFHGVPQKKSYIFSRKISLSELNKTMQWQSESDKPESLTVVCDICVINSFDNFHVRGSSLKYVESAEYLQHQRSVLKMEQYRDFHFIVKNKKFPVHRFLLALESPVFNTMFQTKMNENLTATATVNDVEPEVFENMLNFIYEKHINEENLKSSVFDLFYLAHKYRLQELEFVCTDVLYKNLNRDNVIKVLETATFYEVSELRAKALEFIKSNMDTMKNSQDFVNMIKSNPSLALELIGADAEPYKENAIFIGKTSFALSN